MIRKTLYIYILFLSALWADIRILYVNDQSTSEDITIAIEFVVIVQETIVGSLLDVTTDFDENLIETINVSGTGYSGNAYEYSMEIIPIPNQNGNCVITIAVTVDDGTGDLTDSETFTFTVNPENDFPILTLIGNQNTNEDTDINIDLSASDIDIVTNDQSL
ncbi:hypothetical protein HOE22_10270, partial [Candidatus Woesearchaeota archaeon]|nr:hypothetical protein [Candidatus Woesearchaeota archaeon]